MNCVPGYPQKPGDLLLVLHPGNLCLNADAFLEEEPAQAARAKFMAALASWSGHLLIVDSTLSQEITIYPELSEAMADAELRNTAAGYKVDRTFACDCFHEWQDLVLETLDQMAVLPHTKILMTGGFFSDENEDGAINIVMEAIKKRGGHVELAESAVHGNES